MKRNIAIHRITQKTDMHYYQFNIGDYKSHTSHLTIIEDIAYRRILDFYYLHEKPLPIEPMQVARLIIMNEHVEQVKQVLTEFFTLTDLGWINKRADIEISVYQGFISSGKKGAAIRWGKGDYNPPNAPPNQGLIANTKQEPLNNKHKTINKKQETKIPSAAFALPDWIDKKMWNLWMQTRKGKKMIPAQMQAQVDKLEKWKESGVDYASALAASAEAGWAGLFEPKNKIVGMQSQSSNEQIKQAAYKRLFGEEMPNDTK